MAENGYGVPGHVGRIPNYGRTHVNPMGHVAEPPACIQNAMMTKDKKPFTYTPGGLDLSQIKTPSMARRMNRQRSLEEQEQAYAQQQANSGHYHPQGGHGTSGPGAPGGPPPPPPMNIPAPPPPPPLVISVPKSKSPNPKPVALGERPEIVIPENPIGMLRKTNSPYHWEAEKAELNRIGPVPKFVEKAPSPLTVQMPPSSFSQQPPQSFQPNVQRQNYPYSNQTPGSPVHRPEAQYANQKVNSSIMNNSSPTRESLQRQDSQFNNSPVPYGGQSPISNGSTFSPSPNSSWRQPERKDSPARNVNSSPQSPPQFSRGPFSPVQITPNSQSPSQFNRGPMSPQQNLSQNQTSSPVFHTLPRAAARTPQEAYGNNNAPSTNTIYNNTNQARPQSPNPAPWRLNAQSKPKESENTQNIYHNSQPLNQQPTYTPPWKTEVNNNQQEQYSPPWKQENKNVRTQVNQAPQATQQPYHPPWVAQDGNNNKVRENTSPPWRTGQENRNAPPSPPTRQPQQEPRYQSTMSIPVTPRKPKEPEQRNEPQKEIVYVNQEPVYFCPESPKSIPPWVKTQKEKTKTPPPEWVQRPLEGRRSAPRELVTPPRESNDQEPEWVKKSAEMQRNVREVISPPKYHQPVQPNWSTKPSDNRRSVPKDQTSPGNGSRVIPIQMEVSSTDKRDGRPGHTQPQLRITIGMQPNDQGANGSLSQPTQRIMRVLSPQLVRFDDPNTQPELPTLTRNIPAQESHKTRIIPIQIEGGGDGPKRVYYHQFSQEGPPRQSRAFRVLQIITGTQDDPAEKIEAQHGYTDL